MTATIASPCRSPTIPCAEQLLDVPKRSDAARNDKTIVRFDDRLPIGDDHILTTLDRHEQR